MNTHVKELRQPNDGDERVTIDFGFINRKTIYWAFRRVYKKHRKARGPDGKVARQVFGHGPGSRTYRRNRNRLLRMRRRFRLMTPRHAELQVDWTAKVRRVTIVSLFEQVVFTGLTKALRDAYRPSEVNVCRSDWDARRSVAAVAVELRDRWFVRGGSCVRFRSDLEKAFESVLWREVVGDLRRDGKLAGEVIDALESALTHYCPLGRGIPTGLPFSPVLLDVACRELDANLAALGIPVYRYMDDFIAVVPDMTDGEKVRALIDAELERFGLHCHPDKTVTSDRIDPVDWLGHLIYPDGHVDVSPGASKKLLAKVRRPGTIWRWSRAFGLARGARLHDKTIQAASAKVNSLPPPKKSKRKKSIRTRAGRTGSRSGSPVAVSGMLSNLSRCLRTARRKEGHQPKRQDQLDNLLVIHPSLNLKLSLPSCFQPPLRWSSALCDDSQYTGHKWVRYNEEASADYAGHTGHRDHVPEHRDIPDGAGSGRRGRARPRRPEPIRRRLILELLGHLDFLRLASRWHDTLPYLHGDGDNTRPISGNPGLEARILFGALPSKVRQMARANEFWQQAMAIYERRLGRPVPDSEQERLLTAAWSVVQAAGTLTYVDAVWFGQHDPVQEILLRLDGAPARACKDRIVAERRVRKQRKEGGRIPENLSIYAREILEIDPWMAHPRLW